MGHTMRLLTTLTLCLATSLATADTSFPTTPANFYGDASPSEQTNRGEAWQKWMFCGMANLSIGDQRIEWVDKLNELQNRINYWEDLGCDCDYYQGKRNILGNTESNYTAVNWWNDQRWDQGRARVRLGDFAFAVAAVESDYWEAYLKYADLLFFMGADFDYLVTQVAEVQAYIDQLNAAGQEWQYEQNAT